LPTALTGAAAPQLSRPVTDKVAADIVTTDAPIANTTGDQRSRTELPSLQSSLKVISRLSLERAD
jgi:hypothetical protein